MSSYVQLSWNRVACTHVNTHAHTQALGCPCLCQFALVAACWIWNCLPHSSSSKMLSWVLLKMFWHCSCPLSRWQLCCFLPHEVNEVRFPGMRICKPRPPKKSDTTFLSTVPLYCANKISSKLSQKKKKGKNTHPASTGFIWIFSEGTYTVQVIQYNHKQLNEILILTFRYPK